MNPTDAPALASAAYGTYLALALAVVWGILPAGPLGRGWTVRAVLAFGASIGRAMGAEIRAPLVEVARETAANRQSLDGMRGQLTSIEAGQHGIRRLVERLLVLHGEAPPSRSSVGRPALASRPPLSSRPPTEPEDG